MTKKTTYWLADPYGNKAQVEGAEERDRWTPLGWAEAGEPAPGDRVWLRHEEHGGRAQFPAEVVELWQQKGWQPSSPPPPVDPFNAPAPADAVETPAPAPTDTAVAGKSTSSSEPKEK